MSTMITARIPETLSEKLDDVARKSKRSRSWLVKEALERYLAQEPTIAEPGTPQRGNIMSFAGVGIKLSNRRTDEEIDAEIRWLRGND